MSNETVSLERKQNRQDDSECPGKYAINVIEVLSVQSAETSAVKLAIPNLNLEAV